MAEDRSFLTALIREEAARLGFFKTGVARARPLPRAESLDAWLGAGMHGQMEYMARQAPKRRDPGRVLEGARSLIVVGMNYHTGYGHAEDPKRGRISRYAWGDDYHRLMQQRLEALLDFIRRPRPDARGACYVDTGPVMEKTWGAESALGWTGKHSNLIARSMGSWFFLGVIILNLELDCDPAEKDYCGTCVRCMTACPTGAIAAPRVVDARLCISYLTIELRGSIPRSLRPLIGNRIFGCDDCLEVCPWNRFARISAEKDFSPRPGNLMPELIPLSALTPEEFQHRFHGTPVRRATRDGFVRNVVVALGNYAGPGALGPLARAANDASPLVRGHAAWALGRIADDRVARVLRSARQTESDPRVIQEIDLALNGR